MLIKEATCSHWDLDCLQDDGNILIAVEVFYNFYQSDRDKLIVTPSTKNVFTLAYCYQTQ